MRFSSAEAVNPPPIDASRFSFRFSSRLCASIRWRLHTSARGGAARRSMSGGPSCLSSRGFGKDGRIDSQNVDFREKPHFYCTPKYRSSDRRPVEASCRLDEGRPGRTSSVASAPSQALREGFEAAPTPVAAPARDWGMQAGGDNPRPACAVSLHGAAAWGGAGPDLS
jgi:hypothetical protein